MDAIPQEALLIGGLALAALVVLIVARYAKQILLFLLVAVGVVVLALIAWALLQRPDVIPSTEGAGGALHDLADIARLFKSEPQPAPVYQAPASSGGFVSGLLVALVLVALGVGGYFWLRWKMVERGSLRPGRDEQRRGRVGQGAPVIYVIEGGQADDLGEYDLIPWQQEVGEWTEGDLFQF